MKRGYRLNSQRRLCLKSTLHLSYFSYFLFILFLLRGIYFKRCEFLHIISPCRKKKRRKVKTISCYRVTATNFRSMYGVSFHPFHRRTPHIALSREELPDKHPADRHVRRHAHTQTEEGKVRRIGKKDQNRLAAFPLVLMLGIEK